MNPNRVVHYSNIKYTKRKLEIKNYKTQNIITVYLILKKMQYYHCAGKRDRGLRGAKPPGGPAGPPKGATGSPVFSLLFLALLSNTQP